MQRHHRNVASLQPHDETMWSMAPASFEVMGKTYSAWLSQANRLRDEALRFAQEQFTRELEAAAQLACCTTPTAALAVEAEFASRMAADYLAESQKMVDLLASWPSMVAPSRKADRTHH